MKDDSNYLIESGSSIRDALAQLNTLKDKLNLFIVEDSKVIGSLTDGDVRRGLLSGITLESKVEEAMKKDFIAIRKDKFDLENIKQKIEEGVRIVPVLDDNDQLIRILDLKNKQTILPLDAVIMAGGKGQRLMPLTKDTPKPLLKVGDKPIIEYNIERLAKFGVNNQFISINYLGYMIKDYFKDGQSKDISIKYLHEHEPLGTIGVIGGQLDRFDHDYILVMNSDLLTNIDYESFFLKFMEEEADMAIATTSYEVNVPYAVLETEKDRVLSFKEKPTYTYYSNAGIYILKKEVLKLIPSNSFYNATDLIEELIKTNRKVVTFPIFGYWLDIGKHHDFEKANQDIKTLNL